jgi:glycosyltransferase involved in cell wall biosynthesis
VDDLIRLDIAPPEKFRVIPVGLDLRRFANPDDAAGARFRSRVGVAGDEVLLTYVGRLVPIKRVDVALRAFARAREVGVAGRLAIVGDGECRPELERVTAELGLSDVVSFVGYMEDAAVAAAGTDIAVLSSNNEGTPVSLIEASAAGVPAAATAVGGVPDVVADGETGLLVNREDERALAEAIARLAREPELRTRLGASARRHVLERFSSDRLVRDIEALYDELLAARTA